MSSSDGREKNFKFNGNGNGSGKGNGNGHGGLPGPDDEFEDEEDHEHEYINVAQTPNIAAFEELIHQVITIDFQDRGLTLDFSHEEIEELGQLLNSVLGYLSHKGTFEP